MRVYLVRHGAVSPTREGMYYGGSEVLLSDVGRQEARRAAERLQGEIVDHLVCSPLGRARYGAEQVAEVCGLGSPELVEGFREIDRGRWVGLLRGEIQEQFPGDLEAHEGDPEAWTGHGGESLGQLRDRVLRARDRVLESCSGRGLVVVSHLFPTRAMLADVLGLPPTRWAELKVPTGSVSVLERGADGAWTVLAVGEKSSS